MKLFNKKGMLDDLFDFLFTVMVSVFLLFFIGFAVGNNMEQKERAVEENIDVTAAQQSLWTYLYSPTEQGRMVDLIVEAENNQLAKDKLKEMTERYITQADNPLLEGILVQYPKEEGTQPVFVRYPLAGMSWYASVTVPSAVPFADGIENHEEKEGEEIIISSYGEMKESERRRLLKYVRAG